MRKRWKIWLALVALFLSGVVIGAVGTGAYVKHRVGVVMTGERGQFVQKFLLKRLTHKLDLDKEQQNKVAEILNRAADEMFELHRQTRPKAHAILDRAVTQMKEHLTPEQQTELDDMIDRLKTHRPRFFR